MGKRNAIEMSRYINKRYKEYLRSTFELGAGSLQTLFEQQLENEDLFKGPYVDLSLPFQRGKNLLGLIEEGVVCKSFANLGNINFGRPLYSHQEEAIRKIGAGRSAIITTGTGSGKTESFLYPILNELLSEVEHGNYEAGVRAIFLYPMNALVNDQIDRVREILSDCPEIKYGFFTGDTPESIPENYREKYKCEKNVFIPDNELVSREEMRRTPPHLLFTNYSMLEFLLIRPNDYALFAPERLNNWKYVVLDEAHSYYGSLGIELSLLMRRLTGLAPRKPQFILTSATLGEQGKSENDIVRFAENLTSVNFEVEDIIFSKRIPLEKDKVLYSISGEDYVALKAAEKDVEKIRQIASSYQNLRLDMDKSCLFELLVADSNVYEIYQVLKNGSKSFKVVLEYMTGKVDEEQLIALIDLINKAEKEGVGLFDLKYHSFVRPLSGAYVTLGETPGLTLTKTNVLDGFRAFEVGNCRYCSAPYIIGRIFHDTETGLDYLYQNKEIDIYENYGNNKFVNLDYFLMKKTINKDEIDDNSIEEVCVCAKCGEIHSLKNFNAKKCDCGSKYSTVIYRVKNTVGEGDEVAFNNINQCLCCGHKGRTGIVKNLNMGKDEGTALIAQTLYEAIDEGEVQAKKASKLSLKIRPKEEIAIESGEVKTKQFLSFSDSRQQASFAAVFMDANHVRLLRKRLIWHVIEKNDYNDVSVDEMVAILTSIIKERDLFPDESNKMGDSINTSAHKNAWVTVLYDLLRVDGDYDGEGLGLYYFDLDLSEIMEQIEEDDVKEEFGEFGITKSDLATIMQVVFSVFKTTPAINYVKSTLSPEERTEHLEYRRFDNYVMYNCQKAQKDIKSFLPVKSKDNKIVRYIQKVADCDEESAKNILNVIFNNLAVAGGLLKKHDSKEAYQIDVSKYVVKNYKNSKYYRCSKCGRLTPYNVHNVCVHDNCEGVLSEIDPDIVLANNYYRNQYKIKKIEKIVIEEHTAQLSKEKAKKYQQDFKEKKINILSCSTTFEMGIDLGTLETVFMRNVPPSPANYVQRAGRAGRRSDTAAYVLTYCGVGSHDYTYFSSPEKMISGVINPPYFSVANHKIILRHLMATALGYFFRDNPQYYKSLQAFAFENGVEVFKNYLASHPQNLNQYISEKILPGHEYERYHNFRWFDEMNGNDEKLENFISTLQAIIKEYESAKEEAIAEENYQEAEYFKRQVKRLYKERLIDLLSKYCVIPKYGFPVDVVELQTYSEGVLDTSHNLSRDLKLAITEYAPDSEVIVDKKKYTSKYITLPKTKEFLRHYFTTCPVCRKVNVFISSGSSRECKYCGESIITEQVQFYIEPVNGFKTGSTKESTRMKPKRSYAGEVTYIGDKQKTEERLELGNAIAIETSKNDNLLVMNKSGFYMCRECGYSDIVKNGSVIPTMVKTHNNCRQYKCTCEELELVRLGHSFQTDVARFTIPMLESFDSKDYARALSFMYAFLEGISNAIGVERKDIDGVLELNLEKQSYDVLIYDNVPGGAGHVKRLLDKNAIIKSLKAAHSKVLQSCCDENTSCYNCLRNYYNQSYHARLQRKYARDFIEILLRECEKN